MIASAFAVSAPAMATSFAGNGSNTIIDGNGAFYDSLIPVGTFTDTIDFSVPSSGTSDVGIIFLKLKSGLTNLSASFNGAPITFTPSGVYLAGGLSALVSTGPQQIKISGDSNGTGSYSGTVGFSSAVPELATWLMMIAGVGFTGHALRRRKPAYKVGFAF
jgi:hypothetical protein